MAGYRLNRSGYIGDLTFAQQIFVALAQNKNFEIQLSPYIDHTPSVETLDAERRHMSEMRRSMEDIDLSAYEKPIPSNWDFKSKSLAEA